MGPGKNLQIIKSSDNGGYLLTYAFMLGPKRRVIKVAL